MSTTTTTDVVVQAVKESTTKAAKQNATQTNSKNLRTNDYDVYDYEMVTKTNALNTTNGGDVKSQEVEMSTQSIKTVLIGLSDQCIFESENILNSRALQLQ